MLQNNFICFNIIMFIYRTVNVKAGIDIVFITSKLAILTVSQDVSSESLAAFLDTRSCRLYNMTEQSYPRNIGRSTVCC